MGSRDPLPLRALPRAFVPGFAYDPDTDARVEIPAKEIDKFRKVLRLSTGDLVAILPNDGRLVRCELDGNAVRPLDEVRPDTDSPLKLTVAMGMPRAEKLEEAVRMGTEMGVAAFEVFDSQRTVVRWDPKKREKKRERLEAIATEAAEVCFRTTLPSIRFVDSLEDVLERYPEAAVLSEVEDVDRRWKPKGDDLQVVIGPEGGWAPDETRLIGDRAVTLGPRVLRVDTAVAAACALALLGER